MNDDRRKQLAELFDAGRTLPIDSIPNIENFRFVLILEDGTETPAIVVKNKDGCHAVNASRPFELLKCKGWRKHDATRPIFKQ